MLYFVVAMIRDLVFKESLGHGTVHLIIEAQTSLSGIEVSRFYQLQFMETIIKFK